MGRLPDRPMGRLPDRPMGRLPDRAQLPLEVLDLVAQAGGVLEAEVGRGLVHLLLEGADEADQLVAREPGQLGSAELLVGPLLAAVLARGRGGLAGSEV